MNWGERRTRRIGEILRDCGLVSASQLEAALEEQARSSELLGQVLVRMGVLERRELDAALSVQKHLGSLKEALHLASGVRQMLGALLVQAGRLSPVDLKRAIAEQNERGGKLGEVCVRLGYLDERELDGLLAFQVHQGLKGRPATPLRLGELLVTAGHISREQLEGALRKQQLSAKKLGEVLVEEGYAHPEQIRHGVRLQQLLLRSVLAAVLSLATLNLTGCGSGGAGGTSDAPSGGVTRVPPLPQSRNYFTITSDNYPLIAPTFLYASDNASFWSIQANVAKSVSDPDAVNVVRIDIAKGGASLPALNQTFSIEERTGYHKFPGTFTVFNGSKSVNKRVEQGIISFTPDSTAGETVTGSFEVTLTDYDSYLVPAPQYRVRGAFRFRMNTSGPVDPA